MATTGVGPVKQALVRALRDHTALHTAVGSKGINEGTNPRESVYPHITYMVSYATRDYDSTNMTLVVEVDVWSHSTDQVEAHNLDQLVAEALEDKVLEYESESGQTSMLCRRFGDLSSVDLDGASNRVYQVGGLYRIWSDQVRTA